MAFMPSHSHEAGGGHDDEHVACRANQHGDKRRADHLQHIWHVIVDDMLDLGQQEHADHHCQHTALARHENGAERGVGIVKPQERGDIVDVAHGRDHAQHAAEHRRAAELLGCAITCPGGEIRQQRLLDEEQQVVQASPENAVGIPGHQLLDDHRETAANARHDEAGNQGHKDAAQNLAEVLELSTE